MKKTKKATKNTKELTPSSPFSPWFEKNFWLSDWHDDFGKMPVVDMHDDGKNIIVKADMPGIERKDVDVKVDHGRLIISGKSASESTKEDKKNKFYHHERRSSSMYREIVLPSLVDGDKVEAALKNGVLNITLPKTGKKMEQKIKVK